MCTNNSYVRVCGWCGAPSENEYCSVACNTASMEAYTKDMEAMPQPSLMEAHGDTPMPLCPVCNDRPIDKDMDTCLATSCREQWDIAWSK